MGLGTAAAATTIGVGVGLGLGIYALQKFLGNKEKDHKEDD